MDNKERIRFFRIRFLCPSEKATASEQVQGAVQVNLLPHLQLVFRPHKVVQQHFKDHGAPQAPPFDLELGEPVFQVHFLYIPDSDESGIFHG